MQSLWWELVAVGLQQGLDPALRSLQECPTVSDTLLIHHLKDKVIPKVETFSNKLFLWITIPSRSVLTLMFLT